MRLFQYSFYILYKIKRNQNEDKFSSSILAICTMGLFQFLNFFSLIGFLNEINPKRYPEIGNNFGMFIGICFILLNYLFCVHNKKYLKLSEKFDNEDIKIKKKWNIISIFYFVASVIFFVVVILNKPGK